MSMFTWVYTHAWAGVCIHVMHAEARWSMSSSVTLHLGALDRVSHSTWNSSLWLGWLANEFFTSLTLRLQIWDTFA